jgi:nitric oxide reductase NorD protein
VAEAEDVLLDLAWRGVEWLRGERALRSGGAADPPQLELSALRTELDVFLCAVFDRRFEIVPLEVSRPTPWILPWTHRAPWRFELEPVPATDGRSLYLPRVLGRTDSSAMRALVRVTALGLAARVERGSTAELPVDALARDLYWSVDGARVSAWLCAALAGLAKDVLAARSAELAARRVWRRPTPLEQHAEALVRRILHGVEIDAPENPRSLAHWARETARLWREDLGGTYRGIAPVRHLGVWRRAPALTDGDVDLDGSGRRASRLPTRRVRVTAESPPADPRESREGPWLVPPGDPQLSAEPTSRIARPLDRESEIDLETLASELERFDAIPRTRSEHTVHEVLETDAAGPTRAHGDATLAAARAEECWRYPEWDWRARRYRPDYCHVRELAAPEGDPDWGTRILRQRSALVRALRSQAERVRPRLERQPRQTHGDEIDLDAYVEHRAERFGSRSVVERLYRSERRVRRDFAVALVLDVSASTERPLAAGQRVIDLERETALLFCTATRWLEDRLALYAFSSRGPCDVRVQRLKRFEEPHDAAVERRIAALEPGDCTRLGAALRHVTSQLSREAARARLLLVLSDGRPSDDDGYDGRHGSEDTRRAVQEAIERGIVPFCISIQPDAERLDHVFGSGRYTRLLTPSSLPERLTAVYRELTRRS